MGKKYYITESQMKKLVSHVSKGGDTEQVLEEGFKEVALGAAMLLGATFGGNKLMAQKAQDAIDKTEILTQIKSTLEDEKGKEELAKYLRMNPEQLDNYLSVNADKVESDFEKVAKKNKVNLVLDLDSIDNKRATISSRIRQGYAVSDIVVHRDTILEPGDTVVSLNQIDFEYGSGDMFKSGSYDLKPEVISSLQQIIKSIEDNDGRIVKVNIESSTDTEPINIGNEQLAKNRGNSVIEVLNGLGVVTDVSLNTLPDQGPDLFSRNMTQQERLDARKKTSQYRYVKITFVVEIDAQPVDNEPLYKVEERIEVNLVKTGLHKPGKGKKIRRGSGKITKNKCLKVKKPGGVELKCRF